MRKLSRMLALLCVTTAIANAQWPVNQSSNPRVNQELYGNNDYGAFSQRRYYQTGILPSERLLAEQRSGAMPSEFRLQADAVGPLAPNAPMAYIPEQSPLQRALNMPPPQLYNPAYIPNPDAMINNDRVKLRAPYPINQRVARGTRLPPSTTGYLPPLATSGGPLPTLTGAEVDQPAIVLTRRPLRATTRPTLRPTTRRLFHLPAR